MSPGRRRAHNPSSRKIYVIDDEASSEQERLKKPGLRPHQRRQQLCWLITKQLDTGKKFKVPMLPNVAARALEIAGRPDASLRELHAVVQPDPVLSARILSIANSAMYGGQGRTDSVRSAILRLGIDTMRDVVYQSVAEAHVFHGAAESYLRRQRVHATGVAYLTRDICKRLGLPTESAFAAGLLHDIGCVLVRQILEQSSRELVPTGDFDPIIDAVHCRVGAQICVDWQLPARVAEGVVTHHGYNNDAGYFQTGHIVAAAECLAEYAGLGALPTNASVEVDQEASLWELGLDGAGIEALMVQARELAGNMGIVP